MSWKKQRSLQGKNKYYSLAKKLRLVELASKVLDGRLFGLPVWSSMHSIVQDAMLKWVYSASRTKGEAMRFLGLQQSSFFTLIKKYKVDDYFSELDIDKEEE
jgi:hypothetical protein